MAVKNASLNLLFKFMKYNNYCIINNEMNQ